MWAEEGGLPARPGLRQLDAGQAAAAAQQPLPRRLLAAALLVDDGVDGGAAGAGMAHGHRTQLASDRLDRAVGDDRPGTVRRRVAMP